MDNLYIEAYKFYKNDYAHGLVLFHIQSHFEAYEDDAIQLGAALNLPVHLQEGVKFCSFPDYELENTLLFLVQIGISVNTIEYRDENGVFAIPKVKQILGVSTDFAGMCGKATKAPMDKAGVNGVP